MSRRPRFIKYEGNSVEAHAAHHNASMSHLKQYHSQLPASKEKDALHYRELQHEHARDLTNLNGYKNCEEAQCHKLKPHSAHLKEKK